MPGRKKKRDPDSSMAISSSMREDMEREREMEDVSMVFSSSFREDMERERENEERSMFHRDEDE